MSGNFSYDALKDLPGAREITAEDRAKAMHAAAAHSSNADELRLFLKMLGLL